jgi:prepilin signal peptidase PulO-like enzyme (type II secretory pathway)
MFKKLLKRSRFILLELLGAAVYGVVLYFLFTWLAGYSLLYAYFGSLVLMILLIAAEEYSIRIMESDDTLKKMSEQAAQKGREDFYRSQAEGFVYNTSVKTILYLFYVFILIFSKIVEYNPTLVNEDIGTFILENNFSILMLIALDRLFGQATKERERMRKLAARFKEYLLEKQD